jgi:hypothetical protein
MPNNVNISCAHCGDSTVSVDDTSGIPGVPASYVSAATSSHRDSDDHIGEIFKKERINKGLRDMGMSPRDITESVKGSLSDFTHGKDHNA